MRARSSAVERAATARTDLERSMSTSEASSARAAARTTSGSPRPDSTASEMAAREPRSTAAAAASWAGGVTAGSLEAVVVVEEDRAGACAHPDEGDEDVDAQHEREDPLAHAPVGLPRGDRDEEDPRAQ